MNGRQQDPPGPIGRAGLWLPDGQTDAVHLETGIGGITLKVWFERYGFANDDGMIWFKYNEKIHGTRGNFWV